MVVSLWQWNPNHLLIHSMRVNISIYIYRILDLEDEALNMGFVDWVTFMNARAISFFEGRLAGNIFRLSSKKWIFLDERLPLPESTSPEKFRGRGVEFNIL